MTFIRALALAGLMAMALAACGDDDDEGGGGRAGAGKPGGEFVVALAAQPDAVDPALSYVIDGWVAMWPVYLTPVGYKHVEGPEGSELTPLLAEELPTPSQGGRVYSFRFRSGITYSDGSPLKASDFEHSIKRVLELESEGAFYYEKIKGAEEFVKADDPERADISGIETNDRTREVKITLTRPDGTFPSVLGLQFSGVVPSTTPFRNMTKDPPPGTGSFEITSSVPNRQFVLEKNSRYKPTEGFPAAKADKLTFKIVKSLDRAAQDTIRGRVDALHEPPPPDLQPAIRAKYSDRYKAGTTQSTYFFFLNEKLPPFNDEKARQAVNLGIDKPALARLFGAGLFETSCNVLPPAIPGYRKIEPCPWGDPDESPDLEKARRALRQSSYDGEEVVVWGSNDDPTQKVTEAYAQMLNEIGFRAKPRIIDGGVYDDTVGNQKTKAQTGFANHFADFPSPSNYMVLVNGESIQPTSNLNRSNVDVPALTRRITELEGNPDLSEVADEWAEVDRMVIEGAHGAFYGQRKITTFVSERVDFENCAIFHSLYQTDYSSLCSK